MDATSGLGGLEGTYSGRLLQSASGNNSFASNGTTDGWQLSLLLLLFVVLSTLLELILAFAERYLKRKCVLLRLS